MDLQQRITLANGRLKAAQIRASIRDLNGRLYIQATFPPKPGSTREDAHQQRIALGLPTNPRGIALAESEAKKIGIALERKEFDWEPYQRKKKPESVEDWVARLEAHYMAHGGTQTTWQGDYAQAFKKLPQTAPLTLEALLKVIGTIPANTKSRQRACMAYARLARFADINADRIVALRGDYSPDAVDPRTLPQDAQISAIRQTLQHEGWRWIFGMIAVYGLRPHETFHVELDDFPTVRVQANTKTGDRFVWPLYPEWATEWGLAQRLLPNLKGLESMTNAQLGTKISVYFYKRKLGIRPYDLRHCYARRCLEFGFSPEFGAKMMGHSPETHCRVYRRWIDEGIYWTIYSKAINQTDRPLPPTDADS